MFGRKIAEGMQAGLGNLKSFLQSRYLPQRYYFKSIVPKNTIKYYQIPFHKWKSQTEQNKQMYLLYYLCLFFLGLGVADFIVTSRINQRDSYWYYLAIPKAMKRMDNFFEDPEIEGWLKLLSGFWVKNYYQFRSFWEEVGARLKKQGEKEQQKDAKVSQLKKQIREMDEKFPMPMKQKKQSVF